MSPLTAYLDHHVPDLLDVLRDLVRIDTTNPPGSNYDAITLRLAHELDAVGLKTRRLAPPRSLVRQALPPEQWSYPRYTVLGRWRVAGAKRTLHFNAHYDVVPVSGVWKHGDPFSGTVDRGWLYGRGSADMKGSIASLILALRALRANGLTPRMNLEVSFTPDEETDSILGANWLVEHGPIQPNYALVMEGGERDAVCCGHNGVVWLDVVVHGRAAHGSRPDRGVNAFEKMAALVLALEDHKAALSRRTFVTPEGVMMRPTMNLGGVFSQGPGGKINTVPAEARFSIDRRVLANETVSAAERELRRTLQAVACSIPNCRITVHKVSENHPCFSPPEHPFFRTMAACVAEVRRAPAVFNVSTGFNDMHFFSHHWKIPTLGYGPGGEHYHAVDERARVKDLVECAKIYAQLLTRFEG